MVDRDAMSAFLKNHLWNKAQTDLVEIMFQPMFRKCEYDNYALWEARVVAVDNVKAVISDVLGYNVKYLNFVSAKINSIKSCCNGNRFHMALRTKFVGPCQWRIAELFNNVIARSFGDEMQKIMFRDYGAIGPLAFQTVEATCFCFLYSTCLNLPQATDMLPIMQMIGKVIPLQPTPRGGGYYLLVA